MKTALFFLLLFLAGCEDEQAKAQRNRQAAIEREVEARVKARTASTAGEDSLSTLRMAVYGVTATAGVFLLHLLGAPRSRPANPQSAQHEDRPPRSGGRVLDLHRHETPPRR